MKYSPVHACDTLFRTAGLCWLAMTTAGSEMGLVVLRLVTDLPKNSDALLCPPTTRFQAVFLIVN